MASLLKALHLFRWTFLVALLLCLMLAHVHGQAMEPELSPDSAEERTMDSLEEDIDEIAPGSEVSEDITESLDVDGALKVRPLQQFMNQRPFASCRQR